MRFTGKLKTWSDERGFGFITPTEGGQDIFVHVSELPRGAKPSLDTLLSFEVALNPQGMKKAVKVGLANGVAAGNRHDTYARRPRRQPSSSDFLTGVIALVIVGSLGWVGYQEFSKRVRSPAPVSTHGNEALERSPTTSPSLFKCDGRTYCSQMTSCAEATYFLKNCPGTKMDGNHDGVPCEQQWCK